VRKPPKDGVSTGVIVGGTVERVTCEAVSGNGTCGSHKPDLTFTQMGKEYVQVINNNVQLQ
jgi:hypothetical protein